MSWLSSLADRAHAAGDARARSYGWEISHKPRSFTRVYRDPRFDTLSICPTCSGRGSTATGLPCGHCHGAAILRAAAARHD